ncbi:MAG: hypothetical protein ABI868_15875 [Acidobacteriota bacterium]
MRRTAGLLGCGAILALLVLMARLLALCWTRNGVRPNRSAPRNDRSW